MKGKPLKIPILKTANFILRPFRKGDEFSLQKNFNNKNILKNLGIPIPYPYKLKDARSWIAKNLKEYRKIKPVMMNFAIEINGEVAGSVGFSSVVRNHKAELGYWLAQSYWGKGIMTKAVRLAAAYGFSKLNFIRIYAKVFTFNKASIKVLKKSGYRYEGILRKSYKMGRSFFDYFVFAKIRQHFLKSVFSL